ncbi:MAG: NUDIX domain-containing protein [Nitrospirae bacterium]|nr:NUDIX domain-containing protein [Nitrospirota bacterium]
MIIGGSLRIEKAVALALIYESKEKILMQLRDFKVWISHPGVWALFGGNIKSGETPEAAVIRELREELDFSANPLIYFRKYFYEEEAACVHVFSCCTVLNSEKLHLSEGQEFGFFCFSEILSGKLFSEKLRCNYSVANLAIRIISDYFSSKSTIEHGIQ